MKRILGFLISMGVIYSSGAQSSGIEDEKSTDTRPAAKSDPQIRQFKLKQNELEKKSEEEKYLTSLEKWQRATPQHKAEKHETPWVEFLNAIPQELQNEPWVKLLHTIPQKLSAKQLSKIIFNKSKDAAKFEDLEGLDFSIKLSEEPLLNIKAAIHPNAFWGRMDHEGIKNEIIGKEGKPEKEDKTEQVYSLVGARLFDEWLPDYEGGTVARRKDQGFKSVSGKILNYHLFEDNRFMGEQSITYPSPTEPNKTIQAILKISVTIAANQRIGSFYEPFGTKDSESNMGQDGQKQPTLEESHMDLATTRLSSSDLPPRTDSDPQSPPTDRLLARKTAQRALLAPDIDIVARGNKQ